VENEKCKMKLANNGNMIITKEEAERMIMMIMMVYCMESGI
jgi:hypothetical protein